MQNLNLYVLQIAAVHYMSTLFSNGISMLNEIMSATIAGISSTSKQLDSRVDVYVLPRVITNFTSIPMITIDLSRNFEISFQCHRKRLCQIVSSYLNYQTQNVTRRFAPRTFYADNSNTRTLSITENIKPHSSSRQTCSENDLSAK